ncbi:hypothetical protein BD289DRAFT_508902 [Coniella lustricola]|uniref:Zn(2)-C6 fungal-type domain-containing protein n=1 Tax=Coniella lustricola TaxID=2025994 RepID=A0A2T2ZWW8_9PEZI|nr:hypothetical protein BD289DRAFT_508902 [Coniella lustricola]
MDEAEDGTTVAEARSRSGFGRNSAATTTPSPAPPGAVVGAAGASTTRNLNENEENHVDGAAREPLACVTCRSRKLRCDRTKPACQRCAKLRAPCVYPESRRKPAVKRRNVRELEERLAQVEVLLKDATGGRTTASDGSAGGDASSAAIDAANPVNLHGHVDDIPVDVTSWDFTDSVPFSGVVDLTEDTRPASGHNDIPATINANQIPSAQPFPQSSSTQETPPMGWDTSYSRSATDFQFQPDGARNGTGNGGSSTSTTTGYELLGLGMFEALPPTQMIEELHEAFFTIQHPLIPIVHPGRYLTAFYSAPHLRPPMALQYAIWTMAANAHPKYAAYHSAFHSRARHYLQEDEMRGDGEHFLTVAHAQAWALIATNEARCMWFTRAAMSVARCIKLLHMMGLHRLDDPDSLHEMAPTLAPPKDWTELEERRRTFWGAFAIDSHASISTGWPILIDPDEVTTRLPCSEEAFQQCRPEPACRLQDVFTGSSYSSFAGAAVICHIFNRIMKQVHRSKPSDSPDNYEYGRFWNNHRELDNMLSSVFMFLPEGLRIPAHMKDPVAVHTNLNLHASVICLHNCAYEKAVEHGFPENVRTMLKTRLVTAAEEVVNIVKMTSHTNAGYRSPLVALALYVASSVCILQAKDHNDDIFSSTSTPSSLPPKIKSDIEFLLTAMEAIGKQHSITLNFLRQLVVDLERSNLVHLVRIPSIVSREFYSGGGFDDDGNGNGNGSKASCRGGPTPCGNNIPLFARSRISRHADLLSPLPGRLPLDKPIGRKQDGKFSMKPHGLQANGFRADGVQINMNPNTSTTNDNNDNDDNDEKSSGNKRKRVKVSPPTGPQLGRGPGQESIQNVLGLFASGQVEEEPSTSSSSSSSSGAAAATTANTYSHIINNNNNNNNNNRVNNVMPLPPASYGSCFSQNMITGNGGDGGSGSSDNQFRLPHRTTTTTGGGSSMSTSSSSPAATLMNANSTPTTSSGISPAAVDSLSKQQQQVRGIDQFNSSDNNNNNNNNNNINNDVTIPIGTNAATAMPSQPAIHLMDTHSAKDMLGSEFSLDDIDMFPDLSGWDDGGTLVNATANATKNIDNSNNSGTNGTADTDPSALYAQQVAEAMLQENSWMVLNGGVDGGVGAGVSWDVVVDDDDDDDNDDNGRAAGR